jgi:hypothetical protein
MSGYVRLLGATILLGLGSAAALSQSGPVGSVGALRVTTDTSEYCASLAGQVAAERPRSTATGQEVSALAEEGRQMCDSGLIRGGLLRLRRALLLLQANK